MSWIFESNNASTIKIGMWNQTLHSRREFDSRERQIAQNAGIHPNAAAVIPQDVWREFDNMTVEILRNDEGDVLLNDLLPLAKELPVGKVVHKYRKASDGGVVKRSVSGSVSGIRDKTGYSYGDTVIPVFDSPFGREWREWEAQSSENFDGLIDDQNNCVRAVRSDWANYIKDGDANIVFNGVNAYGFSNSPAVVAFDLGGSGQNLDYTSSTATGEDIRNGFKEQRDILRITNNVQGEFTVYVSREIMSNLERYYSDNFSTGETILQQLMKLTGIREIKETALLSGNEFFWTVLRNSNIRPLVGMPVNTIMLPRQMMRDDYTGVVWGAMGIEFIEDYDGKSGNMFSSELTAPV
jgi:hypothetical protein